MCFRRLTKTVETSYPEPPEFVAQGDRVLVVGVATGKIKATNKTFKDDWVFDITVRNGKLTNDPGVYRHASTGAGLRRWHSARAGVAMATCGHRVGVDGGSAVDRPSHSARSTNAQP